jgi:hypothetical protein
MMQIRMGSDLEAYLRTTLAIDDDVLMAAKAVAEAQRKTMGEVVSSLLRQALQAKGSGPTVRNGIRLLPVQPGALPVTLEYINKLRDELP